MLFILHSYTVALVSFVLFFTPMPTPWAASFRVHPHSPCPCALVLVALTQAGRVSPTVLKLLKMATGMRALLDTVVQALPQVRAASSRGPSCLMLVPCWALGGEP